MTDDLVKQLRWLGDHASFEPHMHHVAADRIDKLAAALRWICGSRTVEYSDGTCSIDETKMLWTYRRIAREALEGIYDERIFKDPT